MTVQSRHTHWCARGHRCGLNEHRAEPIAVTVPGVGYGQLTRVADARGREYAEIRVTVALPDDEACARHRLSGLLNRLPRLIGGTRAA
jgi:hypothetical protein